jgi:uncharacterized protein YjeT (DUF2065 family)
MNENDESESSGMFDLDSKFWRTTLVVVVGLLIFAGPTYVPYVLSDILHVDYVASVVSGIVLLAIGLLLMWYLVRKKVIT